ncbi:MAG TPA: GNAT family N-acetyltransferase [Terriglobia bacterium]|nr:GNAT family N-acetyltransferase [Terriglobia bacterium]
MIETITDLSHLENIAEEWNDLARQFDSPLLQFEWFKASIVAFSSRQSPSVVVVKNDNRIEAIAPVTSVGSTGFRKMEILGASELREPTGLLYRNEQALRELLEGMLAAKEPLLLARMGSDSAETRLLGELSRRWKALRLEQTSATPWIPLTGCWEEYERSISPSRRSSLRRARRRAEALGTAVTEILSPQIHQLDSWLEDLFAVEAAGWKGREGTAMKARASLRKFFSLYTLSAARTGKARLCFLRMNGKPIAALLGVIHAERFWVLKIGYDEQWAACSPGIILMHDVLRWSFDQNLKAFEFLGSNEAWLHIWTDHVHTYATQWVYPVNPAGLFWLGMDLTQTLRSNLVSRKARLRKRWHGKLLPVLKNALSDASH